jgi:hypothetical protein
MAVVVVVVAAVDVCESGCSHYYERDYVRVDGSEAVRCC